MCSNKIGILGGGQLGQMLFQSAIGMGFYPRVFGGNNKSSCRFLKNFVSGNLYEDSEIIKFADGLDILAIEIEHISIKALKAIEDKGVKVFPAAKTLELISNKSLQKTFYKNNNIQTADFYLQDSKDIKYPAIAKTMTGGYDGNGVATVNSWKNAADIFGKGNFFIEKKLTIQKEISVIIARSSNGEISNYPIVEMEFADYGHILEYFHSPANIPKSIEQQALDISNKIIKTLDYVGILAVEFILDMQNNLKVNEIAPRVHNSGHHTQYAAYTSQFTQHWRAITGLSLGNSDLIKPVYACNIISPGDNVTIKGIEDALSDTRINIHMYHKNEYKKHRKMGHMSAIADTIEQAKEALLSAKNKLKFIKD